jgi:ubiquinone biosynthesis accessory factor UbiJ
VTSAKTLPAGAQQLVALLGDLVGRAADAAVRLDPVARARLEALEDQQLRLEIDMPAVGVSSGVGPRLTFTVTVSAGQFRLRHHAEVADAPAAHAIVSGPASAFMSFLAPARAAALPAGLRISGDIALVEAFQALAAGYAPDFSEPLGRVFGPRVVAGLLDAFELAGAGLRTVLQIGADAAGDAARRVFADRPLTLAFLDELDELRLLLDRVEARVDRLERHKPLA